MNEVLAEMAKQVPAALAVVGVVWLFLRYMENQEVKRIANAKEMGETQRAHDVEMQNVMRARDLEMNNLWASTVKNIMENQNKSSLEITTAIKDMQKDMVTQYEKLGITKDLWDAARNEISMRGKST
jgi:hypothetical protein